MVGWVERSLLITFIPQKTHPLFLQLSSVIYIVKPNTPKTLNTQETVFAWVFAAKSVKSVSIRDSYN